MSDSLDNLEQRLQALDRASRLRIPGSLSGDLSGAGRFSERDALRLRRGAGGGGGQPYGSGLGGR